MRTSLWTSFISSFALMMGSLLTSSCSGEGAGPGTEIPPDAQCQPGQKSCVGNVLNSCSDTGLFVPEIECAGSTVCDATLGCVSCSPGNNLCVGTEVHAATPLRLPVRIVVTNEQRMHLRWVPDAAFLRQNALCHQADSDFA